MAQFTLVASEVSGPNFQKAMDVVNKSGGRLVFVPQQTSQHGIQTQSMSSGKANPNAQETYQNIRFEWQHDAADLGAELTKALAGK